MATWYVSSVKYAATAAWSASATKTVGSFVRSTTGANSTRHVFRCSAITTGITGGSEPAWPTGNNATVVDGGVTWTNVTGQSTYGWSAAAGSTGAIDGGSGTSRLAAGDLVVIDKASVISHTAALSINGVTGFTGVTLVSVDAAGSVPPVPTDYGTGAKITVSSGALNIGNVNIFGCTLEQSGTSSIVFNGASTGLVYLKDCLLTLSGGTTNKVMTQSGAMLVVLDNTPISFSNAGQAMGHNTFACDLQWLNTPNAIQGTAAPSLLFNSDPGTFTLRGVDISAIGSGKVISAATLYLKVLLDGCKIDGAVTRISSSTPTDGTPLLELANCYDGTNNISERYTPGGAVTTEFSTTLVGGATSDGSTLFSHKMVSTTRVSKKQFALESFAFDVQNNAVGSAKTATIEFISSGSLNDDEIILRLEYQATSGSAVYSGTTSGPTNPLSSGSAVATSTATWNSPPATPVKQKLVASFTPNQPGRLRGWVELRKPSTTVYINPAPTIA